MKFQSLAPMLWVKDIRRSLFFYTTLLGFHCVNQREHWATLEKDGIELMLSLPNAREGCDKMQFTGSFYFRCAKVDQWWEVLRDKAPIVYPIENFDYGMREFAIRDLDGYILQFGAEI
jgi:uncharacterized glyoxalase superfamily protein PhnB